MSYPRIWSGMRMDGATGAQSGPTGKTKYFQEVNRFRYDDNGRLTHVSLNNAEFEQIKPQDGSGNSELTTIGAGDRLLEADGYSYRYDAEGNVIQRVYNVATKDRLIIDNTKVQSGKTSLAFDDPGTTATGSYTPEPSIAPTQREYRGTAGFFAITDFFAKAKFFDVTPGSYDLWATWKPVTDGALGKFDVRAKRDTDVANVISTGNVDFKLQPNDFIDEAGIRWQKAATIQVKDRDELHVILKKVDIRAAGAIVFDAIQLTPTVVKETYTWDHRNQLAKTTQFNLGGQKTTEVLQNIDAGGRLLSTKTTQFNPRTGAVNSQQTMQHIHDGMNRIADVKVGVAASDAKLNNVYLVDNHGTTLAVNAITPTKAQAANWYFYDTVGAARSVASNESGWNLIHRVMTVQGTVDRTIGDWRKGNITDSPVIWKGAIQTPITRTYVIGGRTYDSTMNRYLSEDSLAAPGSTNRYIVADNNPLASLTPADSLKGTGKSWESQYLKAFSQSYAYYFNPANNWNSGTWEGKIFGGVQYLAWGSAAVAGVGIGAAGLAPALGTAGGLSLALGGAGAGAINTYVYNPDANFVEYAMGVGFGGLNPIGEAISVGGGVVGAGIAGARGGSARTGYQIGSTITGLLGAGVDDYFRAVGKMIQAGGAVNRAAAARHAMAFSGASAGMGAAGAALGYQVGGAQGALIGAQIGGALAGFAVACFTAGTPLVVDLDGNSRPIDEIEVGDAVLARSEFDPSGPLELKRVEEKFVRTAVVMELVARPVSSSSLSRHALASGSSAIASSRLSLAAGSSAFELAFAEFTQSESGDEPVFATQSIKTTAEHPFYVPALGKFVPAGELQPGDLLISSDDQLIEVVEASSTDEVTTVYNLRVADHHTYFVGGAIWGWDVWVHNASYQVVDIAPGVAISRSLQRRGDRLHQRATEIVGQLSPGYDTVAVARVRDANGHIKTLIATNQTTLPSKIKLRQREEFIGIEGHAESSIMQWLDQNPNWTLDVGAASRNICWRCAGEIQQMGYQIANMKYGSPGARANATDFRVFFRQ